MEENQLSSFSFFPLIKLLTNFPSLGFLIFLNLSALDLINLILTNKFFAFNFLIENSKISQELWKMFCFFNFKENISHSSSNRNWKQIYSNRLREINKKKNKNKLNNDDLMTKKSISIGFKSLKKQKIF